MSDSKKWYQLSGNDADVVISTRVRLARNLRKFPFPCIMTAEQRAQVNKLVRGAIENGGSTISDRFSYIELDKLSQKELVSLVERHLISPGFAHEPAGKALLLLDDESVSIMICEEDHIRIQVLCQGMAPDEAYDLASKIDRLLAEQLDFATSDRLGYLTACPTNLGTAMRASVMLHIPALETGGALRSLSESISKLGLVIRGMYGEGSGSKAAIYQISNQETLGVTEKDSIAKLTSIIGEITRLEREARAKLIADPAQSDRIWRAYGILRSARMLSGEEFVSLFSQLRMGAASGVLSNISLDELNALFINAQPATLMCTEGADLAPQERDRKRADMVRQLLE